MTFDYSDEHFILGLCFNVVISNLRGSKELGLFTCVMLFKLLARSSMASGEGPGLGSQAVQVCVSALRLLSIVTLGKYT